jgi:hypothetical protein
MEPGLKLNGPAGIVPPWRHPLEWHWPYPGPFAKENTMRHNYSYIAAGMAVMLTFAGCDLIGGLKKTDDETAQPATEATVVGIWRSNIPTGALPPKPTDIKVTMQVDAGHTMILSQRIATGLPKPDDFVEISKETWSWSVVDGKMNSTKTACVYKDPATMKEIEGAPCSAPASKSAEISVKGKAWTVVENGQPIVFRKD